MLSLIKAKFVNKRIVKVIANFVYILKNNSFKHSKATVKNEDKYFNYYKMGYFYQNCIFFNYYTKKNSNNSSNNSIRQDQKNDLLKL